MAIYFYLDCHVSIKARTRCAPKGDDGKNQFASLNNFVILNNNVAVASACRWHAHCVNNLEKSTQGVTTPCYKKWIALARLKPTE